MEDEKTALILRNIQEGKDRHETRRALISEGFSTENFDAVYKAVLSEHGLKEPTQAVPHLKPYGGFISQQPSLPLRRFFVRYFKIVVVLTVLAGVLFFGAKFLLSGVWEITNRAGNLGTGDSDNSEEQERKLSFSDSILQTKVKATVASANLFGRRMTSYGGVCSDISIVAPVECKDTETTYVIFAPLSDNSFYCVDSKGFNGFIDSRPVSKESCTKK